MAHILRCEDVDFIECPMEIRGDTTEEVVQKAIEHGVREHKFEEVTPELREKLRHAVLEEPQVW
jgi:predicted small metal-binding protein